MIEIVSQNNIKNGSVVSKEEMEKLLEEDNAKIYEVIRVMDRKPVFLEEHYQRMVESIRLSGVQGTIDFDTYKKSVEKLIYENSFNNCNIRVSYYFKDEPVLLFYFVKSFYPPDELFKEGIYTVTVNLHRDNPNIKAYKDSFKDLIAKTLEKTKAFEAILVNDDFTVSEGSKSNLFFVKGNKIVTSLDSQVLLGVTRSKVIEVCFNNEIEVEKRTINKEEIQRFDAAFITGTSNDVLPIKAIDGIVYCSADNEIVKKVYMLYMDEVKKEIVG